MSLGAELSDFYNKFHYSSPPELGKITATIRSVNASHKATFDTNQVIKPGNLLPPFTLPDAMGNQVSSTSLLSNGPLLISFYRGSWCPFCNIELRALQKYLPEFKKRNVTLVAISPELPDSSLDTKQRLDLEFTVLSDVRNKFARQLGLAWTQPEEMRGILKGAGWKRRYGTEELEIPVAGTFLVDREGVVRNVFVEPNWHERLEPEVALEWIDAL
jgi:peroxiredoxin